VTLGAAKRLVASGHIKPDDGPVVISITGQGLKTQDPLLNRVRKPDHIGPSLNDFDKLLDSGVFAGYIEV
jgi:threonine synthase